MSAPEDGNKPDASRSVGRRRSLGAAYSQTMTPEVATIPLPTPFDVGTVNCYLVRGDVLMLVDAGPCDERALAALEAGLGRLGHRIEDIELLFLTHQHYDHVGLAAEIKRRSNADVAGHRLLASFVADFAAAMEREDAYADAVMQLNGIDPPTRSELLQQAAASRRYGASFAVDRLLDDGDRIDVGGGVFDVLLRPGHSPTDTLLVLEHGGIAFVGDHLIAHISSNPIMHRPPHGDSAPHRRPKTLVRYLESLGETAREHLTVLYPGHGQPIDDHRGLIARRLRHHEDRKARIAREIGVSPATGGRLIEALWPSLPLEHLYLALSEVLGHVDLLLADGIVRERERDGVIEFSLAT